MYEPEYSIHPFIEPDGTPTWKLWIGYNSAYQIDIAQNRDKSVLEKAIEHLKQNV